MLLCYDCKLVLSHAWASANSHHLSKEQASANSYLGFRDIGIMEQNMETIT